MQGFPAVFFKRRQSAVGILRFPFGDHKVRPKLLHQSGRLVMGYQTAVEFPKRGKRRHKERVAVGETHAVSFKPPFGIDAAGKIAGRSDKAARNA